MKLQEALNDGDFAIIATAPINRWSGISIGGTSVSIDCGNANFKPGNGDGIAFTAQQIQSNEWEPISKVEIEVRCFDYAIEANNKEIERITKLRDGLIKQRDSKTA